MGHQKLQTCATMHSILRSPSDLTKALRISWKCQRHTAMQPHECFACRECLILMRLSKLLRFSQNFTS